MYRVYYDKDGTASTLPFDREEAKRVKSKIYMADPCPECEKRERYVRNDICVHCAMLNANDLFCYLAGSMMWDYHPTDPQNVPPLAIHKTVIIRGRERKYFKDRPVTWEHERAVSRLSDLVRVGGQFARSSKEALDLGLTCYVAPTACDIAGHYGIRTLENRCYFCEEERLKNSARATARRSGSTWYTPSDPCPECGQKAERRVSDNRCSGCFPMLRENSFDPARADARVVGADWYTPSEPCPRCGQKAERRVSDNRCSGCFPRTRQNTYDPARAEARRTGATWYTPTTPCPVCDETADRRTQDNRCSGCFPRTGGRRSPTTVMMEAAPDMIISREDARRLELKVFRTGLPCRRGHTGFRWVSTGGCIECLNGASCAR